MSQYDGNLEMCCSLCAVYGHLHTCMGTKKELLFLLSEEKNEGGESGYQSVEEKMLCHLPVSLVSSTSPDFSADHLAVPSEKWYSAFLSDRRGFMLLFIYAAQMAKQDRLLHPLN